MSTPSPASSLSNALNKACLSDRQWYIFFLSSLSALLGGMIIIGTWNLISDFLRSRKKNHATNHKFLKNTTDEDEKCPQVSIEESRRTDKVGWFTDAKNWSGEIVSGQTKTGQVLVTLVLLVSMASLTIYLIDTYTLDVETCDLWSSHTSWQVDLGFNIFFFVYFIIQFLAAPDKFKFWIEIYSIVDYFTIIPSFTAVYLNRNWLGFRFLRVLRIMTVPDVLQFMNLLHSSTTTRLCNLIFTLFSVWMTGSGFVYLLENSGDPFRNYENGQKLTFWECIYFTVVTMSTVGYGDITCKTILGQIFNVIFLLGGLAMFATLVPEIADILGERSRYREPYKKEHGRRHVVLCGHITAETVSHFVADFLHCEREDVDVDVVIMNKKEPDIELQRLLKCHYTQLHYIQGNTMNTEDLGIAQIKSADACLILADKYCPDIDAEDAGSIMRVISIKSYASDVKVIIQLLQYHSKTYLMNIPSWNWEKGDDAICLAELKLGFIAQSCLAPGFSTLMANLFIMRSYQMDENDDGSWIHMYKRGSGMEMYSIKLSTYFVGMSFPEAAELCFHELKILLVAIETTREESTERYIAINPGPSVIIEADTQGFFIAQSAADVKIASYYCKFCLPGVTSSLYKSLCGCLSFANRDPVCVCEVNKLFNMSTPSRTAALAALSSLEVESTDDGPCQFDSTGMFHWCPDKSFLSCVISKKDAEELIDHIIVCLFADSCSPVIGLQNFVMPLRASNFHYDELKTIVIVGEAEYLRKEWKHLCNCPKLFMIFGSPLNRALLRTININLCEVCVILTAKKSYSEDSTLLDKEAILCSLNIQAMVFGETNRKNAQMLNASLKGVNKYQAKKISKGSQIPMITELDNNDNAKYIEHDIECHQKEELYLIEPFASGAVFTVSVLDSLMSTAYYSNNSLSLIRTLITGGSTPELEQILAEGMTLECGDITSETIINRERCKVAQFDVSNEPFLSFVDRPYEDLFLHVLKSFGALCLGLYRVYNNRASDSICKRYVVTNPPNDCLVISTDQCFCLCPGNKYPDPFSKKETETSSNSKKF